VRKRIEESVEIEEVVKEEKVEIKEEAERSRWFTRRSSVLRRRKRRQL
jgi:hypothetical protein